MDTNKTPTKGKKKTAPSIHRAVVLEISGPVKDTDYRHLLALLTHEDEFFSGMILAIGTDGILVLKNRTDPVGFREFTPTSLPDPDPDPDPAPEALNFSMKESIAFLRQNNPHLAGMTGAEIWNLVTQGLAATQQPAA